MRSKNMKVAMQCLYFGEKQAACPHGAEVTREDKEQSCSGESIAEQEAGANLTFTFPFLEERIKDPAVLQNHSVLISKELLIH